jgi:hypothetical protein
MRHNKIYELEKWFTGGQARSSRQSTVTRVKSQDSDQSACPKQPKNKNWAASMLRSSANMG